MKNVISTYELIPTNSQKSFYKKAIVKVLDDNSQVLFSYQTPVIMRKADGTLQRLWSGYSATTQKHINAFCGLNKAAYMAMPVKW